MWVSAQGTDLPPQKRETERQTNQSHAARHWHRCSRAGSQRCTGTFRNPQRWVCWTSVPPCHTATGGSAVEFTLPASLGGGTSKLNKNTVCNSLYTEFKMAIPDIRNVKTHSLYLYLYLYLHLYLYYIHLVSVWNPFGKGDEGTSMTAPWGFQPYRISIFQPADIGLRSCVSYTWQGQLAADILLCVVDVCRPLRGSWDGAGAERQCRATSGYDYS